MVVWYMHTVSNEMKVVIAIQPTISNTYIIK